MEYAAGNPVGGNKCTMERHPFASRRGMETGEGRRPRQGPADGLTVNAAPDRRFPSGIQFLNLLSHVGITTGNIRPVVPHYRRETPFIPEPRSNTGDAGDRR